jgi:hypothetical protein
VSFAVWIGVWAANDSFALPKFPLSHTPAEEAPGKVGLGRKAQQLAGEALCNLGRWESSSRDGCGTDGPDMQTGRFNGGTFALRETIFTFLAPRAKNSAVMNE